MRAKSLKRGGFTLVELMITITIIGILSASVTISISNFVLQTRGEAQVMAFFNQMQQMRTFALRDNDRYLVRLAPGATPAYEIFRDWQGNGTMNTLAPPIGNRVQLFVDQEAIANSLIFSNDPLPATLPPNGALNGFTSLNDGIGGDWRGTPDNVIVFENDEIGNINSGMIFLQNPSASNVRYAIVRPQRVNSLQLWRWDGRNWTQL